MHLILIVCSRAVSATCILCTRPHFSQIAQPFRSLSRYTLLIALSKTAPVAPNLWYCLANYMKVARTPRHELPDHGSHLLLHPSCRGSCVMVLLAHRRNSSPSRRSPLRPPSIEMLVQCQQKENDEDTSYRNIELEKHVSLPRPSCSVEPLFLPPAILLE